MLITIEDGYISRDCWQGKYSCKTNKTVTFWNEVGEDKLYIKILELDEISNFVINDFLFKSILVSKFVF